VLLQLEMAGLVAHGDYTAALNRLGGLQQLGAAGVPAELINRIEPGSRPAPLRGAISTACGLDQERQAVRALRAAPPRP
jgi:hypothetical protein